MKVVGLLVSVQVHWKLSFAMFREGIEAIENSDFHLDFIITSFNICGIWKAINEKKCTKCVVLHYSKSSITLELLIYCVSTFVLTTWEVGYYKQHFCDCLQQFIIIGGLCYLTKNVLIIRKPIDFSSLTMYPHFQLILALQKQIVW